ncbi:energy-coupling factor ABC transporter ATP-binding protein [Vibrio sp. SS-MA-C1-2]|uniref:energy-coupling factor ABC transporter ATP-binding protein n=1 Tax=Vibrio sp. SS-MA-C1-2 TaxID=2908646 RepID=UPI001F3DD62D|nr:energy-coupling factor ABC transporter ATP-binding protein [Vibrio sp. SS-MA-C1-2]UJF17189.1 energy-coupling factor ABC transporter ATP-binding protein [Vibrio sp. SS-MA-C1-2]
MITCKNVTLIKDNHTILSDISVNLTAKRIGIIGHNGSGKTTFSKLLNGLEIPTSGEVSLFNQEMEPIEKQQHVGFVFQNPDNQIIFPIVEEDIGFGLTQLGLPKKEIQQRVEDFLNKFNLGHLKQRLTHQLSGGEKQLIALIGVLIMQPEYIILDEPTTLLDLKNRLALIEILNDLQQKLIIVSHDLELMSQMDQLILFHSGSIVDSGEPTRILTKYQELSRC